MTDIGDQIQRFLAESREMAVQIGMETFGCAEDELFVEPVGLSADGTKYEYVIYKIGTFLRLDDEDLRL